MKVLRLLVFLTVVLASFSQKSSACTNLIVTPGASADGASMLVYTNDGEWLYHLKISPSSDHLPSDSVMLSSNVRGKIPQVAHTYKTIGFHMNEHQLAIGETTFTGRVELWDKTNPVKYWHLMSLALERASSAREAITVMTEIMGESGYGSEGESFSIVDPDEAWIMEVIGDGEGGALWVARRIPDGCVSAHANMSRIGEFPLHDPENCVYSDRVIDFAIEKGYYLPENGVFRFNEVYNPTKAEMLKYCETRVWSLFNRIAPSLNLSTDYHRGVMGAQRYPLWIKPDKKLSLKDVMALVRDHYEGTSFDKTQGIAAGPFNTPFRCSPLQWSVDSVDYSWERSISTPNTCFSFVAQCRNYLPDELGGVLWFGFDDTFFTCYTPFYATMDSIPESYRTGDINRYDRNSTWWLFNFVSNYANLRYVDMINDIQSVQVELETLFIHEQAEVEKKARTMSCEKQKEYLTNYAYVQAGLVHHRWKDLGDFLIMKYNDGYVKDTMYRIKSSGYPNEWLRGVIKNDSIRYIMNRGQAQETLLPF